MIYQLGTVASPRTTLFVMKGWLIYMYRTAKQHQRAKKPEVLHYKETKA